MTWAAGRGRAFSINLPVPAGADEAAWVSRLEHIVVPAALEFGPDLVLISAGYDAHRDDAQGGCELEALAGDEPPEMVAPDFLTTRAASYIGHYWTL
jgi:acetoin utilization deacetylase AcuC-like enzyme